MIADSQGRIQELLEKRLSLMPDGDEDPDPLPDTDPEVGLQKVPPRDLPRDTEEKDSDAG
jgi:hypothetical protein